MSDYWLREANRRGDESDAYASWIESNKDTIIERYREHIEDIDQVPDHFIESMYESYCENS